MTPRNAGAEGQKAPAVDITNADLRRLMSTMATLVQAIADGQVTVDGQAMGAGSPGRAQDTTSSHPHPTRPTVKELRAQAQERAVAMGLSAPKDETPQVFINVEQPEKVNKGMQPRVVYELATKDKRIDATGLTPAGVAILKYLAANGSGAIMTFMSVLGLKRSTIANVLTELKRRKLVESKTIE